MNSLDAALPFVQHSDRCQRSGMGACLCSFQSRLEDLAAAFEDYHDMRLYGRIIDCTRCGCTVRAIHNCFPKELSDERLVAATAFMENGMAVADEVLAARAKSSYFHQEDASDA